MPELAEIHRPEDHRATCYCGRPARHHVSYGSGCGNVCGIHMQVCRRRKGPLCVVTGAPILATQAAPASVAER